MTDANGNFVGEGATPAELTFFVPEPSTVMLMPLMLAALMLTRLRAVRSLFGDR